MTTEQKLEIFAARLNGLTYREIERIYGVSRKQVMDMLSCASVGISEGQIIRDPLVFPNIQIWMRKNGESITSLAKKISVTRQALNNYLHGQHDVPKKVIDKILKITDLTYEVAFYSDMNSEINS